MTPQQRIKWLDKPILFFLSLVPLFVLVFMIVEQRLGANPIETVTRFTGDWTLRFLLITLSVTPLRHLTGLNYLLRLRRMLGLFVFFYASLHFSIYWLDQQLALDAITKDVIKRPYITVGFSCFVLLIPLVVTSTSRMVRWLGARRWQQLHRLVYVIAIGGVIHFLWLVKSDITQPLIYAFILAVLLGYRLYRYFPQRLAKVRNA